MITIHSGLKADDLLCRHEFDDGSLCGRHAEPERTRCSGHRDDGQPDHDLAPAEQRDRR